MGEEIQSAFSSMLLFKDIYYPRAKIQTLGLAVERTFLNIIYETYPNHYNVYFDSIN